MVRPTLQIDLRLNSFSPRRLDRETGGGCHHTLATTWGFRERRSGHLSPSCQRVDLACLLQTGILMEFSSRYTNADGRCLDLLPPAGSHEAKTEKTELISGQTYKVVFRTKEYFERTNRQSFYPWVEVRSAVIIQSDPSQAFTDFVRDRKPRRTLSYPIVNQSLFLHNL